MIEIASRMSGRLRHRGPDDGGVWCDAGCGVALAMRRLAVLDLSPAGHQPMHSASGRFVLVYNGEIYNFQDLRQDLLGLSDVSFRGQSDTEVMLAAFDQWGIEGAVRRFNGMFAFAVWDRVARRLTLGRDRFGEKPLYYALLPNKVIFGSELKALMAHPECPDEIDRGAVALFLRHDCIPAPYSIYRGIRKLPPGTLLTLCSASVAADPAPYYPLHAVVKAARENPFVGSEPDAVDALDALLRDSVRRRMLSDVPLGAFLSGGIDSSTVVALMQLQSNIPVKSFSIGLHESGYNEASDAARVAEYLRTDHTELFITHREAIDTVPMLSEIYDEPFADPSQIPTFLVSRLARERVAVSLSGDAGDELFGGYNRHAWAQPLSAGLGHVPRLFRSFCAAAISNISPDAWDWCFDVLGRALPNSWRLRTPGYKLHKLASVMESSDSNELYLRLASHWFEPSSVVIGGSEPPTLLTQKPSLILPDAAEQMMFLDTLTYLPDDILVKLDRATMAVSLEGRVPFLDHRIAEFAWRLPLAFRVRGREGKSILKKVLYRYVPRELVERPKAGFGIPLGSWLRGPLKDWASSLLDEDRIRQDGFFDPKPIRMMWKEHLSGRRSWEYHLWNVLVFNSWLGASRSLNGAKWSSA